MVKSGRLPVPVKLPMLSRVYKPFKSNIQQGASLTDTDKLKEILESFDIALADTSAPFGEVVKQAHSAILDLFLSLVPEEMEPGEKFYRNPHSFAWNNCRKELLANIERLRKP